MTRQKTGFAPICFVIALSLGMMMPPVSQGNVTIAVGNGVGLPGSTGNQVEISLDNQNDKVKGLQLDVCDGDNFLTLDSCEITERSSAFDCAVYELEYGCGRILLYNLGESVIGGGTGPVLTIRLSVSETAPDGECRSIDPGNIKISNESKEPIPPARITTVSGEFCFKQPGSCPAESLYGEQAEETSFLRRFRDDVISTLPRGKELIQLYYALSPVIVKMMDESEEFKTQLREIVDGVLLMIGGKGA
jgi:hypothetical protein